MIVEQTNQFLGRVYDRVFTHIDRIFPNQPSYGDLDNETIAAIRKSAFYSVIQSYVVSMVTSAMDASTQSPILSQSRLDELWAHCETEDFAKQNGLKRGNGQRLAKASKQSILEEIASASITLGRNKKMYVVRLNQDGLHIQPV